MRTLIRILCYLMIAAILFWFIMNVAGVAHRFIETCEETCGFQPREESRFAR